ncbi:MAG: DUF4824 family protein [Rhodocyclales bacterium]|nr:DUF4824 family protein [Rhodocyclales bacterium]
MTWSRTHTLIAGIGLIIATNAVALLGVAWNRNGEPESSLVLSRRELGIPYYGWGNNENSGISLELEWRALRVALPSDDARDGRWSYNDRSPAWLDEAKMEALGFPPARAPDDGAGTSSTRHRLTRDVLLVLELDGPAYQTALARAAEFAARQPDDEDARQWLRQERFERPRLFVVDAGLDAAALRARYPDRSAYAIARGQIRPYQDAERGTAGVISDLSNTSIHVPLQWHSVFDGLPQTSGGDQPAVGYSVRLDFGKRLEPWIAHAERASP